MIVLPGWSCEECRAFNGSAREVLTACRCCGAPKPGRYIEIPTEPGIVASRAFVARQE